MITCEVQQVFMCDVLTISIFLVVACSCSMSQNIDKCQLEIVLFSFRNLIEFVEVLRSQTKLSALRLQNDQSIIHLAKPTFELIINCEFFKHLLYDFCQQIQHWRSHLDSGNLLVTYSPKSFGITKIKQSLEMQGCDMRSFMPLVSIFRYLENQLFCPINWNWEKKRRNIK